MELHHVHLLAANEDDIVSRSHRASVVRQSMGMRHGVSLTLEIIFDGHQCLQFITATAWKRISEAAS